MPDTKLGHCSLCATHATLYGLPDGSWACRELGCYELMLKLIKDPPKLSIKDF